MLSVSIKVNGEIVEPDKAQCLAIMRNCRAFTGYASPEDFTFVGPEFDPRTVKRFWDLASCGAEDIESAWKESVFGESERRCLGAMAEQLQFDRLLNLLGSQKEAVDELRDVKVPLDHAWDNVDLAVKYFAEIVTSGYAQQLLQAHTVPTCARIFDRAMNNGAFQQPGVQQDLMEALLKRMEQEPGYSILVRYIDFSAIELGMVEQFFNTPRADFAGAGTSEQGDVVARWVSRLDGDGSAAIGMAEKLLKQKAVDLVKLKEQEHMNELLLDRQSTLKNEVDMRDELITRLNEEKANLEELASKVKQSRAKRIVESMAPINPLCSPLLKECVFTVNIEDLPKNESVLAHLRKVLAGEDQSPWKSPLMALGQRGFPAITIKLPAKAIVRSYKLRSPDGIMAGWALSAKAGDSEWQELDRQINCEEKLAKGEEVEFRCTRLMTTQELKFALVQRNAKGFKQIALTSFEIFGTWVNDIPQTSH